VRVNFRPATAAQLLIVIIFPVLSTACGQVTEAKGSVCTGFNGSFYPREQEKEPTYYTVGDSKRFFFDHPGTIALNNLDLHKTYAVRVFEDGELVKSWNLRFDKLKVRMVTIWRSPGYWHMERTPSGKCRQ
jgi:hypothetical protein